MKFGKDFFCPFRQRQVPFLPEEKVRSLWLQHMEKDLGYPKGLILVEKTLEELPLFLSSKNLPLRRVDILVFYKKKEELLPLLLIECKSGPLKKEAFRQIEGYNYFIKAPFIACVNEKEAFCFSALEKEKAISFIPSYEDLKALILS